MGNGEFDAWRRDSREGDRPVLDRVTGFHKLTEGSD